MRIFDPSDSAPRSNKTVQVRLGGVTLPVPLHQSEEETLRLAEEMNDRLKAIESSAARVDSQAFALQLAYSYALEVELLKMKLHDEQREIEKALEEVLNRFKVIARNQPVLPDTEPPTTPPEVHHFKPRNG